VVTFDPHPWLDSFAQLWNLSAPTARIHQEAQPSCPALQLVLERERQGRAADAAIGAALARLPWHRIARLQACTSSQRLLLFKVKGLRLSGWARTLNARGCPHCETVGADGGHTFHIMWHCGAAQTVWLLLLRFSQ
jgi:hypothetical protein